MQSVAKDAGREAGLPRYPPVKCMCVCVQTILGCREAEKTAWGCCCAAGVERPRELSPAPRITARRPQGCLNTRCAPARDMTSLSEGSALDLPGPCAF